MPLALAVMLWTADVVPIRLPVQPPAQPPAMVLSAADLARTRSVMMALPAMVRAAPFAPGPRQAERLPEQPADLALLFGSREAGGQIEMGALGGGRADAPGLVHIGVGLDF